MRLGSQITDKALAPPPMKTWGVQPFDDAEGKAKAYQRHLAEVRYMLEMPLNLAELKTGTNAPKMGTAVHRGPRK